MTIRGVIALFNAITRSNARPATPTTTQRTGYQKEKGEDTKEKCIMKNQN